MTCVFGLPRFLRVGARKVWSANYSPNSLEDGLRFHCLKETINVRLGENFRLSYQFGGCRSALSSLSDTFIAVKRKKNKLEGQHPTAPVPLRLTPVSHIRLLVQFLFRRRIHIP
jgi:hypothetical protein